MAARRKHQKKTTARKRGRRQSVKSLLAKYKRARDAGGIALGSPRRRRAKKKTTARAKHKKHHKAWAHVKGHSRRTRDASKSRRRRAPARRRRR